MAGEIAAPFGHGLLTRMGAAAPVARCPLGLLNSGRGRSGRGQVGGALPIFVPKSSVSGLFGTIWPSSSRSGEKSARIAVGSTDFVPADVRSGVGADERETLTCCSLDGVH